MSGNIIFRGKRIDIKAIQDKNHNLIVKRYPHIFEKVDIFVLVLVEGAETHIIGWLDKEQATKKERLTKLPLDTCYLIDKTLLNKWKPKNGN